MKKYIISDPDILGGKPVIIGTRIPVARIIHLLKEGFTIDNIAEQYPHMNKNILNGAIDEIIEYLDRRGSDASQVS